MAKKIIKIILIFLISFFFFFNKYSALDLNISSDKYILYNLNDNKVLLEKKSDEITQIASLTKIMTVLVAIEEIENYEREITITKEMLEGITRDISTVGFKIGEKVTINDLLYAAILGSGADAVNALALTVCKNFEEFVDLMNKKVTEIGLENTHFQNVIGLTNENNYSTAKDVSLMLLYALNNEKFKTVFETKEYTTTTNRKIKNTIEYYNSKLNKNIDYISGSKTGYTRKAGYCLASTATINNVNYLLITLNSYSNRASHVNDTVTIYDYFSENYDYFPIVEENTIITKLKTKYAKEKEINVTANKRILKYLKNDFDKEKLKYKYSGKNEISYFTPVGTKLGNVIIEYDGNVIDEFKLIYNEKLRLDLVLFIINKKEILIAILILTLLIILKASKKK